LGGGGICSGSSAARGLRGEMGGLSLIDATWFLPVQSWPDKSRPANSTRPRPAVIAEYGKTVD
jgi:hypothetical protein